MIQISGKSDSDPCEALLSQRLRKSVRSAGGGADAHAAQQPAEPQPRRISQAEPMDTEVVSPSVADQPEPGEGGAVQRSRDGDADDSDDPLEALLS